ncbi:MAG TPA: FtsK/SpoIIIE domain-containing protein, partial [Actinotalea sp.]|nr:FtsK/SpoIIIE domain-containing protein [Actinotalea sp.]
MTSWAELVTAGLVVTGPRAEALRVVHGLLGAALARPRPLAVTLLQPPEHDADWTWCRWLGTRLTGWGVTRVARDRYGVAAVLALPVAGPTARHGPATRDVGPATREAGDSTGDGTAGALNHLVVSDSTAAWGPELQRWWTGRDPHHGLLVLEEPTAATPPWCGWVLRVSPGSAVLEGPGGSRVVEVPAAHPGWIEAQARRVAARDATTIPGRDRDAAHAALLPRRVALADLGLPGTAPQIRRGWGLDRPGAAEPLTSLVARLGVAATGDHLDPVDVDLLAHGPHALVAGTTGAGKSELLQALVLGLALRYPPTELALVLVDFKGGAGLGRCGDLPHVAGQVGDLDPVEAGRALSGLRAELRRREHLLAAHGVTDLEALRARGPAPPRLVVVVDELRALVEDLPDFVPQLVRVAAQGRSLGIHLVLATQRPAGAVDAQTRANVAIRVCLRVTDAADSLDVLDVPDAAALPTDRPGRAVLRCGPGPVRVVQTAWPALRPTGGRTSADRAAVPDGPGSGASVQVTAPPVPTHAT